ncbi:MAG: hypothetical protein GX039_03970, partial [Clostridia bacterium]|nr:hypothetical protein [Clostridia bacterium]
RGALAGLKQPFTAPLVIDIGGGSTEISWQGREGICFSSSPVGVEHRHAPDLAPPV